MEVRLLTQNTFNMSKNFLYIIILVLILMLVFSGNGSNQYKDIQKERILNLKKQQEKDRNEIQCLQDEIKNVDKENKEIVFIDNGFKKKYYDILKKNTLLKDQMASIRDLVLPYHKLDSIAAIVEYTKN